MKSLSLFGFTCFLSVVLLVSCNGGSVVIPGPPQLRHVSVEYESDSGTHPYVWSYTVSVYPGDGDIPQTMLGLTKKIEVDFGDGNGFVDVTEVVTTYWQTHESKPNHIYEDPGDYTVTCRVTYFDDRLKTAKKIPPTVHVE